MTVFGIIWVAVIFVGMLKSDIKYIITIVFVGMIWQCNNVIMLDGGFSVGPQVLTSAAFLIKSLLYKRKKKYVPTSMQWAWGLLLLWVIIICAIHGQNDKMINVIMLGVYVCTFVQLSRFSVFLDYTYVKKVFLIVLWFIVGIGALQFVIEVFDIPKNTIVQTLIYNDITNTNICYNFKNVERFYSSFMEPSYAAPFLVGAFFFVLSCKNEITFRRKNFLLAILLICIALSKSSTAYGAFAVVVALYIIRNSNDIKIWLGTIVGCITVLFLMVGTNVLNEVIFDKLDSVSGIVRSNMNERAMENFLLSPVTGAGYKLSRGSSIVPTLLGELGVIALAIYVLIFFILLKKIYRGNGAVPSVYMVLSAMICQIIACPDLDLCTFWLTMYFFAIHSGVKSKERCNK